MRGLGICVVVLLGLLAGTPAVAAGIDGIAHVAFRVSDLNATRTFYRRLGFAESFVFMDGAKPRQVFVKINDRQFIELYPRSEPSEALGWMHVCYEADDAQPLQALYAKRGVDPSAVRKAGAGNYIFTFKGTSGETIEVTQYLPGSRHSEDRGKHLGAHRVSHELQEIKLAVPDLTAARYFYIAELGFEGRGETIGLSQNSDESLVLEPAGTMPQFVFRIADANKIVAPLKHLGLAPRRHGRAVQIHDPDGNILVFRQEAP